MSNTRKSLRQRIGGPAYLGCMIASTATGGSTTTLLDTKNQQLNDFFNYSEIVVLTGVSAGDYRYVTDWVQSTGTFTADRVFTSTGPASTNEYEVWRDFTATDVNGTINQALLDAKWRWPRRFFAETVLMADNTYRYALPNTTITNAITSASPTDSGTLTVGSTANFPSSGRLKIENEYIDYSAVATGTTFTLASSGARGANSSTAAAHAAGVEIGMCPGYERDTGLDLLEYDSGMSGTGPPWRKLDDDYYEITEDNGVLYLQLSNYPPYVGKYFRLTYRARPLQFTADTGTGGTLDPDSEGLAAYICAHVAEMLCRQKAMKAGENKPGDKWTKLSDRFKLEAESFKSQDTKPKQPGTVKYGTWGDVDTSGADVYIEHDIGKVRI